MAVTKKAAKQPSAAKAKAAKPATRLIYPISADDHVWEKPDTFISRVPAKFRDSCLQIENKDGWDWWMYNGNPVRKVGTAGAAMHPERGEYKRFVDAPPAAYNAVERLKTMDKDGVGAEILFPQAAGFGGGAMSGGDTELRMASIRAYNDYVIDEWAAVSPRFVPQCLLPFWDVNLAIAELKRAAARGHRGIIWSTAPQEFGGAHFNDKSWDPLWATAQELDLPVALHIGSGPAASDRWSGYSFFRGLAHLSTVAITSNISAISNLLFCGVLDRFPNIKFMSVESGLGWVPYLLETADHQYNQQRLWKEGMKMKPSDYFKRNIYVNFWYEKQGVALRKLVGVNNVLWEADFPHPTSTYPDTKKILRNILKDVSPADQYKMLEGNARRVYKLDYKNSIMPKSVGIAVGA